jgi:hypothetical protein
MDDYDDFELDFFHDLFSVIKGANVISLKQKDLEQFFKKYFILEMSDLQKAREFFRIHRTPRYSSRRQYFWGNWRCSEASKEDSIDSHKL